MVTKLERATRKAIWELCEAQGHTVKKIHRVIPRAYVVARPAMRNLVVAVPPCDIPGLKSDSMTMMTFDPNLKSGDWCSIAYVTTEVWAGKSLSLPWLWRIDYWMRLNESPGCV